MFIKFSYMKRLYVVGGIYRHPNGNIKHFVSDLENALSSIVLNCTVIIAGDINIDLIKFNLDDNLLYVTTFMSHGYLPYITLPTRITDFSTTCIDHIFVKDVTKESRTGKKHDEILSGMFYCDISDHLPCFLSLLWQRATYNNPPLIRIFGEKNILKFKRSMIDEHWEDIYTDGTDWFAQFISVVKNKFEMNFPMVHVSRKRAHDKPWITSGLKRSIKTNNRLYKLSVHRGDPNTNYKYKNYKNLLRKCIKAAEDLYYHNLFSDAKISIFNLWKHLWSFINPRKKRKP